jgi:prepilin-type N-terminal cleavage/methylation domain-containing protein/prepilin-type processing-associated H-X9-DG protein
LQIESAIFPPMIIVPRRAKAFSLIELLVVIGLIGLLIGILLPALEKGREQAVVVKCATNLRQIGQAITLYCNENHGAYPRTIYVSGATLDKGTNPAATDPFSTGGPVPNDTTAAWFLLLRTQKIPPVIFTCPYTDVNVFEPDNATDFASRSNFTDYKKNLGYSFANPYPDDAGVKAEYKLTSHLNPGFAVAADLNSGEGGNANSDNHEDRGQNVLYADGHVTWQTSPLCGLNNDNIYVNKNNTVWASPIDASDSVLLPAKK